jgi:hypothetical protein
MSADGRKSSGKRTDISGAGASLLLCLAAGASPLPAAEEPPPDAAFLEYLGSWEGTDEDWLLFEGAVRDPAANVDEEQSDSSEESPESKDEY